MLKLTIQEHISWNGREHEYAVLGVSTDSNGHLYLLDFDCVFVSSMDGKDITTILRAGRMPRIHWYDGLSGLVILQKEDGKVRVSLMKPTL